MAGISVTKYLQKIHIPRPIKTVSVQSWETPFLNSTPRAKQQCDIWLSPFTSQPSSTSQLLISVNKGSLQVVVQHYTKKNLKYEILETTLQCIWRKLFCNRFFLMDFHLACAQGFLSLVCVPLFHSTNISFPTSAQHKHISLSLYIYILQRKKIIPNFTPKVGPFFREKGIFFRFFFTEGEWNNIGEQDVASEGMLKTFSKLWRKGIWEAGECSKMDRNR